MKMCNSCTHIKNGVCEICGCVLEIKTRCMEAHCALDEIGETPKWLEEDETKF